MNSNTLKAKNELEKQCCTCVFANGENVTICSEHGLKPLLTRLGDSKLQKGFSAADKVVGKAPAFLYVLLGASEVYAPVMSEGGKRVLEQYGIGAFCDTLTGEIRNRDNTDICPMEKAVSCAGSPHEALECIRAKIAQMNSNESKPKE